MATSRQAVTRNAQAEVQAWYLGRLRPKLERAAHTGTVAPAAVAALDRELRELLDLNDVRGGEAA